MRQIFTYVLIFCCLFSVKAQNTFPYNLDWGTYVGGCGTLLMDKYVHGYSFHKDSQDAIYVGGQTILQSGYTAQYYNQFVSGGGNNVVMTGSFNDYSAKFSSSGQFLYGSYDGTSSLGYKNLIGIDSNDNKYYLENLPGSAANLATANVWLSASPFPTQNFSLLLSKHSSSGTLIWKTYLPNPSSAPAVTIKFDSKNGSVYVMARTNTDIPNLTTSGVFQENYIPYSSTQSESMYLVKLNSLGQKVWATYLRTPTIDFEVSGNSIYILTNVLNTVVSGLTTSGTFQADIPAKQILFKFDGQTGTREWGTYFGSSGQDFNGYASEIELDGNEIYISGSSGDLANNTYYSTPSAYKTSITGNSDLYLNKFDATGNRVWGTYFGSNNSDSVNGFGNLAVFGNRIIIIGKQYSNTDNIATLGAFRTTPAETAPNSSNGYFAEFDSLGDFKYCSYLLARGLLIYSDEYNPEFLSDGSLVIWAYTGSTSGVGTPGSAFPTMINPFPSIPFGYILKFVLKNPLSTSESDLKSDIQLYDNPNNGDFYISGSILEKQKSSIKISDMSGRLIASQNLEKKKTNFIQVKGKLSAGNYLLELISEKGEQLKVFKLQIQ